MPSLVRDSCYPSAGQGLGASRGGPRAMRAHGDVPPEDSCRQVHAWGRGGTWVQRRLQTGKGAEVATPRPVALLQACQSRGGRWGCQEASRSPVPQGRQVSARWPSRRAPAGRREGGLTSPSSSSPCRLRLESLSRGHGAGHGNCVCHWGSVLGVNVYRGSGGDGDRALGGPVWRTARPPTPPRLCLAPSTCTESCVWASSRRRGNTTGLMANMNTSPRSAGTSGPVARAHVRLLSRGGAALDQRVTTPRPQPSHSTLTPARRAHPGPAGHATVTEVTRGGLAALSASRRRGAAGPSCLWLGSQTCPTPTSWAQATRQSPDHRAKPHTKSA